MGPAPHASLVLLLALVALAGAPGLRGSVGASERRAVCRSYAALLAQVADARQKEGDDRPLDAESLIRTELSDAPDAALEGMLALAVRLDRERWTPAQARAQVDEACPGWLAR